MGKRRYQVTSYIIGGLILFFVVMAILVNTTSLGDSKWMRIFFGISALNFTLRASVPLILGAMCGILCERTGIINIGIEGMMLAGAFAAFVAKTSTNDWPLLASLLFGVAAALVDWRAHGAAARRLLHPLPHGPDHLRHGADHPGRRVDCLSL